MAPDKPQRRMNVADPELQAMAKIDEILAKLPDLSLKRVVAWVISRYAEAKLDASHEDR